MVEQNQERANMTSAERELVQALQNDDPEKNGEHVRIALEKGADPNSFKGRDAAQRPLDHVKTPGAARALVRFGAHPGFNDDLAKSFKSAGRADIAEELDDFYLLGMLLDVHNRTIDAAYNWTDLANACSLNDPADMPIVNVWHLDEFIEHYAEALDEYDIDPHSTDVFTYDLLTSDDDETTPSAKNVVNGIRFNSYDDVDVKTVQNLINGLRIARIYGSVVAVSHKPEVDVFASKDVFYIPGEAPRLDDVLDEWLTEERYHIFFSRDEALENLFCDNTDLRRSIRTDAINLFNWITPAEAIRIEMERLSKPGGMYADPHAYQNGIDSALRHALVGGIEPDLLELCDSDVVDLWDNADSEYKIEIAVMCGADPNFVDEQGNTPLHLISHDIPIEDSVRRLLASGADPTVSDLTGRTPEQIMRDRGYDEVADILQDYTSTPTPGG